MTNSLRKVGVVHRIAHSAVSWLEGQNNDNIRTLGQTPYHLHLDHLSELNILGVNPCLPDRMKFNLCLGMDQVIVSAIENEKTMNLPLMILYHAGQICATYTSSSTKVQPIILRHLRLTFCTP